MAKILNERDVRAIIYATCLMGAGGGGSFESGIMLFENYAKKKKIEVKMISIDEMPDDGYAGVVASMGSPAKFKERGPDADLSVETIAAYEGLKNVSFFMNRKITGVLAIEYGAVNSFVPMMVAMEKGEPFIDADGCGRAVPALNTLLFDINGIATGPTVMASPKGDALVSYMVDPYDAKGLEAIGRNVCMAFDMCLGIAGWMSSKEQIRDLLVPDAYTYALKVGHAMLDAIDKKLDVSNEIGKVVNYRELWRGKIVKFDERVERGFDFGYVHFDGIGDYAGKKFKIDYQNENLVAYEGDKPILTVPDLICYLNLDTGLPMANADVEEGQNVLVCAMPAPEAWFRTSRGCDCWKPFFENVGYKGDIIRF